MIPFLTLLLAGVSGFIIGVLAALAENDATDRERQRPACRPPSRPFTARGIGARRGPKK